MSTQFLPKTHKSSLVSQSKFVYKKIDEEFVKCYHGDLLTLINLIVFHWNQENVELIDSEFEITLQILKKYSNPNKDSNRYIKFTIPKKRGGERTITAPKDDNFKKILSALNLIFSIIYTPSKHATGFVKNKSIVSNAKIHKCQNYVFNIDLKDFFPSITQARVWKRLQLPPFNFPKEVASVVAGICCMRITTINENNKKLVRYGLPQGAPTSPIISNMICDNLDRRLAGVAKRFNLNYSRYADDITFSSMHNVYQKNSEFIRELKRIITQQGFTINEEKTRLQKKGSRQEVTGIVVNEKKNLTHRYVRELRNILYIYEKYGGYIAANKFFPRYLREKGHVKITNLANFDNILDGKLLYLKMVKGKDDNTYKKLREQFDRIHLNDPFVRCISQYEDKDINGIVIPRQIQFKIANELKQFFSNDKEIDYWNYINKKENLYAEMGYQWSFK